MLPPEPVEEQTNHGTDQSWYQPGQSHCGQWQVGPPCRDCKAKVALANHAWEGNNHVTKGRNHCEQDDEEVNNAIAVEKW